MKTLVLTCSAHSQYAGGYVTGLMESSQSPHWAGWMRLEKESDIARARSRLVHLALQQPYDSFLFIDDDIIFRRADFDAICEPRPDIDILAGVYCKRRQQGGLVCHDIMRTTHPDNRDIVQVRQIGTGFLRFTRAALVALDDLRLPVAEAGWTHYFNAGLRPNGTYLSEDYAFCSNAWSAGIPVWMHRAIRLGHQGPDIFIP
jgi:hypothetical protein